MARGKHLFPFRTEPLSPSAPMVLGLKGPGRVGRRRFIYTARQSLGGWRAFYFPMPAQCTWRGSQILLRSLYLEERQGRPHHRGLAPGGGSNAAQDDAGRTRLGTARPWPDAIRSDRLGSRYGGRCVVGRRLELSVRLAGGYDR